MQHCVLEDSSFVIATIDPNDKFHEDAVFIYEKLLSAGESIKVIIPSPVFFETVFTLIKNGVNRDIVEKKLWNFLYVDQIINVTLIETMAFKLAKKLTNNQLSNLRTADYLISTIGIQYQAQILTFDRKMYEKVKPIHSTTYFCSNIDEYKDESLIFLRDLAIATQRKDLMLKSFTGSGG